MANDNNQLALIITEQDKSSGEVIHLVPNSKQSIQPKSLLRLGSLFRQSRMAATLWHEVMSSMQRLSCVVFLLSLERGTKRLVFLGQA
jgi:hypothetical protein